MAFRTVPTTPIADQKTGTSGLRKKVTVFQQPHYLENWIQGLFNSLPQEQLHGCTLVIGGDGRFYNSVAIQKIICMAAANGVGKLLIGQNGLLSTPAVSAVIRETHSYGGIILTASHNPGGPNADFGIKFNVSNGGPAPESVTDRIYAATQALREYKIADLRPVELSAVGTTSPLPHFVVEVIDACEIYARLMERIFDFPAIRALFRRPSFRFLFDALSGVTGVYAKRIFVDILGAPAEALVNCTPLEDFGGHHPDPNLTYAKHLVDRMYAAQGHVPVLGAASDGDGDRNMILGDHFFVTPPDSVAVIAHYWRVIPYFAREGRIKGLARSMPTAGALDVVAQRMGVEFHETPTGWKFFGNLMDAGLLSICGEESFGTGSDHIREKDGIWAVLAWLSIIAHKSAALPLDKCATPADIMREHWTTYGRHIVMRHDYENVDSAAAAAMMQHLMTAAVGHSEADLKALAKDPTAQKCDSFTYTDPIDHSVSPNQGIRFYFSTGSRFVVRLSGTGSSGATIRLYFEAYDSSPAAPTADPKSSLAPIVAAALNATRIAHFTGRDGPTVVT
ncbi:Phosphoglucomutase [Paratrimastix pyriformis]|uniref:phosphoglucomutase (alpha-D-glucose-1,6-bisphosphate-dependent) n=1 Tax=Paratrimastix pyriformis TaxID=342808 RepID=A0ABQ8UIK5_9EUKA|nr:Phosphoglucomutase [Paratrimastix pyriformis]